jgi:hypothetical protein
LEDATKEKVLPAVTWAFSAGVKSVNLGLVQDFTPPAPPPPYDQAALENAIKINTTIPLNFFIVNPLKIVLVIGYSTLNLTVLMGLSI